MERLRLRAQILAFKGLHGVILRDCTPVCCSSMYRMEVIEDLVLHYLKCFSMTTQTLLEVLMAAMRRLVSEQFVTFKNKQPEKFCGKIKRFFTGTKSGGSSRGYFNPPFSLSGNYTFYSLYPGKLEVRTLCSPINRYGKFTIIRHLIHCSFPLKLIIERRSRTNISPNGGSKYGRTYFQDFVYVLNCFRWKTVVSWRNSLSLFHTFVTGGRIIESPGGEYL